ncbi:hypothetical protein DRN75_01075 [Nanoarchaeota archaeon]|nr:MAG: hypothetical protein DRN75_01075 [Nanoarchaeota archaeon]
MRCWYFLVGLVILSLGCVETGQFKSDGYNISYFIYPGADRGVLLVHMMAGSKSDYVRFATLLNSKDYTVMAIDLRGHGSSTGTWFNMNKQEFLGMKQDVCKAIDLLQNRTETVYVVGASIGANAALMCCKGEKIVLLSPGLNYHGLDVTNTDCNKDILIVVGKDDTYACNSSVYLANRLNATLWVKDTPLHGTDLLDRSTMEEIIEWLS